jgi:hypothetical protein
MSGPGAGASVVLPPLPDPCPGSSDPPPTLECTGLYTNIATKQVAAAARSYAPAVPLWSDGAGKNRWVYLPPGTTIDASTAEEWVFPVGTRFWKEFSIGGQRVETRLFKKTQPNFWVFATYAWNADESAAVRFGGGDGALANGGTWHIPTGTECTQCHKGRADRILGFEQVLLGLPGAPGITLAQLVAEGRISPAPAQVSLQIGDDGTGVAAPALGWLHVNCGVTCHNTNTNSLAYAAGMNLRLDPTLLDGRSSAAFDSILTSVGLAAKTASWNGAIRIVPGDPSNSLLVQLISHRGMGMQMPPIASRIVDDADVARVVAWVNAMPLQPGLGVVDAGVETGTIDAAAAVQPAIDDANGGPDGGIADATLPEAAPTDEAASDASPPQDDASAPDALE